MLNHLREKVRNGIRKNPYPRDTAGYKMTSAIPIARKEQTIGQIEEMLIEKTRQLETINYIYIVDEENKLIGVISIKEIFRQPKDRRVEKIMKKPLITVPPLMDQEKVAHLALKHNLKSIPVVDQKNRFLGIVPSDKILAILNKEAHEDIFRLAGIDKPEEKPIPLPGRSTFGSIKIRLPWLLIGLVGGLLAARIVNNFESTLKSHLILATFLPLIVYISNAIGIQIQTLFIRSLAVNHYISLKTYIKREFLTSFSIAFICGLLFSLITALWQGSTILGLILGFSMFTTIAGAILISLFIPWLLHKTKQDPAIGSGPFATIVSDILSIFIYFSITSWLLELF